MSEKCTMHGPLQSLRKLVKAQHSKPGTEDKIQLTYAMTSFPPEVQLCDSSVPCHCYGVSAQHFIPIGTWIGPYEGIRLSASELRPGTDTSYMWEVLYLYTTIAIKLLMALHIQLWFVNVEAQFYGLALTLRRHSRSFPFSQLYARSVQSILTKVQAIFR